MSEYNDDDADLSLSLDVIFHLVENAAGEVRQSFSYTNGQPAN